MERERGWASGRSTGASFVCRDPEYRRSVTKKLREKQAVGMKLHRSRRISIVRKAVCDDYVD